MEWLFPENIRCIICNVPISRNNYISFCKNCYKKLEYIQELCIHCGRFGRGSSICTQCIAETYHFDKIYSVLEYNDFIHHQIYAFKYGHKNYLGKYFARLMKDFIRQNHLDYDFITGVPISVQREKERGFNQSYLLAKEINEEAFVEMFSRKKSTNFLSGLSKIQRILELENAFSMHEEVMDEMMEKFYSKDFFSKDRSTADSNGISSDRIFMQGDGMERISEKEFRDPEVFSLLKQIVFGERSVLRDKPKEEETYFRGAQFQESFAEKEKENEKDKKEIAPDKRKMKLLIVDDILTTGSTLNELSKLVKSHISDIEVIGLTLCSARK